MESCRDRFRLACMQYVHIYSRLFLLHYVQWGVKIFIFFSVRNLVTVVGDFWVAATVRSLRVGMDTGRGGED